MKLPTWEKSFARDKEGTATPLEKFISAWEPLGPDDEAFRRMLADVLRAENARLTDELREAEYELKKERLFIALDNAPCDSEEADSLLEETAAYDEHPEWYDDACFCQLCCSYGD